MNETKAHYGQGGRVLADGANGHEESVHRTNLACGRVIILIVAENMFYEV